MATSKKANLGQTNKVKPIIKRNVKSGLKEDIGLWTKGAKASIDFIVPKTKEDLAWMVGGGAATRAIGGITKKGAKFVSKVYRNMGK